MTKLLIKMLSVLASNVAPAGAVKGRRIASSGVLRDSDGPGLQDGKGKVTVA